jgi:cob(I)alamin adenosyltransferase
VAATPVADLVTKERRSSSLLFVDIERTAAELDLMHVLLLPVGAKAVALLAAARTIAAAEKSFMIVVFVIVVP